MAAIQKLSQIKTLPGIKRDGTVIDGDNYQDGQWMRFQRGKPKKMAGFQAVLQSTKIARSVQAMPSNAAYRCTYATQDGIYSFSLNSSFAASDALNRTPAAFSTGDYCWTNDVMYDAAAGSDKAITLWHPSDSLSALSSSTATSVYVGDAYGTPPLIAIPGLNISGGICVGAPHLIVYGSDGLVGWSNENEPQNFSTGSAGFTRATGLKIVKALPLKGAGYAPSFLLWSIDSVIRMYRTNSTAVFGFDTLTTESSILAQNSVIEYDGMYFWIGQDRFMYYAGGQVQELPNDMNLNWFFDNLNRPYAQKIWTAKNTRYGEIWWFYPHGNSTECSRAVIFNVKGKFWFDVELNRTAGTMIKGTPYPLWFDGTPDPDTLGYDACVHELGYDKIKSGSTIAIPSWFETCDFGYPTGGADAQPGATEGLNRWTRVVRVEPDFLINGTMTMTVLGREYMQGPDSDQATVTFDGTTPFIDVRTQARHPRLRFESNCSGGFYEMGRTNLHAEPGDVRS